MKLDDKLKTVKLDDKTKNEYNKIIKQLKKGKTVIADAVIALNAKNDNEDNGLEKIYNPNNELEEFIKNNIYVKLNGTDVLGVLRENDWSYSHNTDVFAEAREMGTKSFKVKVISLDSQTKHAVFHCSRKDVTYNVFEHIKENAEVTVCCTGWGEGFLFDEKKTLVSVKSAKSLTLDNGKNYKGIVTATDIKKKRIVVKIPSTDE